MKPRLKQPLFSVLEQSKLKTQFASTYSAANLIRLYDVIWNMLYEPNDMQAYLIRENAEGQLEALGAHIERLCGEGAFETPEPSPQLEFDLNSAVEAE